MFGGLGEAAGAAMDMGSVSTGLPGHVKARESRGLAEIHVALNLGRGRQRLGAGLTYGLGTDFYHLFHGIELAVKVFRS